MSHSINIKVLLSGKQCEVDVSRNSCNSHPGICKGGKCADLTGGGFECLCELAKIKDELTRSCELRSRQFKAGDFLMLPGIKHQWHFDLFVRWDFSLLVVFIYPRSFFQFCFVGFSFVSNNYV